MFVLLLNFNSQLAIQKSSLLKLLLGGCYDPKKSSYDFFGAPQKHQVLEHQQPKHRLLFNRVSKTSSVKNIEC